MTKIMIIIADPARNQMYTYLARMSGAEVLQSEGALHALTQLERSLPDAIVCDAQMEDMTGDEFRMVVNEEARSSTIPVFLLPDFRALQEDAGLELAAPCGPELLRPVLQVAGIQSDRFVVPVDAHKPAQLEGDLSQLSLPDLLNWVSEMRLQGHWLVTVKNAQGRKRTGHLFMDAGDVNYAEYAGLGGKAALLALFQSIATHQTIKFRFFKTEDVPSITSADLRQTTSRLLMELAVDIDHSSVQAFPPCSH